MKYNKQIASDLLLGITDEDDVPLSVIDLCLHWQITQEEYEDWKKEHKDFAYASEIQELRLAKWWQDHIRNAATGKKRGNSILLSLAAKNIKPIGWKETIEETKAVQGHVGVININILPTHEELKQLQHGTDIEHAE